MWWIALIALLIVIAACMYGVVTTRMSWRLAVQGLDLSPTQEQAFRLLRVRWRQASRVADQSVPFIHRILAISVHAKEDGYWAGRMAHPGWTDWELGSVVATMLATLEVDSTSSRELASLTGSDPALIVREPAFVEATRALCFRVAEQVGARMSGSEWDVAHASAETALREFGEVVAGAPVGEDGVHFDVANEAQRREVWMALERFVAHLGSQEKLGTALAQRVGILKQQGSPVEQLAAFLGMPLIIAEYMARRRHELTCDDRLRPLVVKLVDAVAEPLCRHYSRPTFDRLLSYLPGTKLGLSEFRERRWL